MNMRPFHIFLSTFAIALFASCQKETNPNGPNTPGTPTSSSEMQVPSGFAYETDHLVNFNIGVQSPDGSPIKGVRVFVYNGPTEEGGELIHTGFTGQNGFWVSTLKMPVHLENLFVRVNHIGLVNEAMLRVEGNSLNFVFGANLQVNKNSSRAKSQKALSPIPIGQNYYFMGTSNSLGVPDYLEPTDDVVTQSLRDMITQTLPERVAMDESLIGDNYAEVLQISDLSDVWVTFVHEGAGYKNVLAYYTYPTNNPPADPSELDSIFVVFPNVSFTGSGGGLTSGNKVKLGTFDAGTTLGFVILANAFNSNTSINLNSSKFFSNTAWNQVANPALSQHHVFLRDWTTGRIVIGFEDIYRGNSGSDKDFNDVVFYVDANPITAIANNSIPFLGGIPDTDGDGIPDFDDDFPTDATKAFAVKSFGTLAYEDLWPYQGDYDFNDLVVDYDSEEILNALGDILEINIKFTYRAAGAEKDNGFAFMFDGVSPSQIASSILPALTDNYIQRNGNGTELGQSKAVFVVNDRLSSVLDNPNGIFVNTIPGGFQVDPETVETKVVFTSPQNRADVGFAPYNPFLIVGGERGREVHLSNYAPSDLVTTSYFNTNDDDSNPNSNRYYLTPKNLPWAIHLSGATSFAYPNEQTDILLAYPRFAPWAQSSGQVFPDWYLLIDGQVVGENIYNFDKLQGNGKR